MDWRLASSHACKISSGMGSGSWPTRSARTALYFHGPPNPPPPRLKFSRVFRLRRRLASLSEECLGGFGKRGEFQTHARRLGVHGFTGNSLGIHVRE